jgi:hypothetical protein
MAVYPVVAGNPDYSSTSSNAYIPAIYSALLVKKFYPETVFSKISNTDYEGDIKSHGDTVNIRTRPTIETFKYKKGMVLPVQNPESPYVTLKVDQGEGFSFALDRVDEFQSDIKLMNAWGEDAGKQMAQVIDRNVLGALTVAGGGTATNVSGYTAAGSNTGIVLSAGSAGNPGAIVKGGFTAKGTSISTTLGVPGSEITVADSTAIVNQILLYGQYLDENNAPQDGRFVILPSKYIQLMKAIDKAFGQAYATGQNTANVLTGTVPKIDRFDVIFSNNLPASSAGTNPTCVLFGVSYATTFATQITESRIIDNPFAFGKMMQGLQVYGFNVIKQPLIGFDAWKTA